MEKEIYYFSGTGNSLHVARELSKRMEDVELKPMVKSLNTGEMKTKSKIVGFVFPLYFTTLPFPVRDFIKKLDVTSADYLFSVVTRIGTLSVANTNVERLLKKKGKMLDAQFLINMASNSPTGLTPGKGDEKWVQKISPDKVNELEKGVQKELGKIVKVINDKEKYPNSNLLKPFYILLERLMYLLTHKTNVDIGYYTDDSCTSCGICEKVCPSGKVKLENGKPVWLENEKCFYCFACFNACPTQSILIGKKYTKKDGRYFHPDITYKDIAEQK